MSEPAAEAPDTVMDSLLDAMDEDAGVEPEEETVEAGEPEGDEPEQAEETEDVAGEEDTTEEAEEEEEDEEVSADGDTGEPEASESVSFETSDPAVLAYLARYDNDPQKALKAAVELQRVLTRQGREKNQALARVRELEQELEQAQMFSDSGTWLNPEQQEYVQNAVGSEQPQAWVQQAVRAGEFDLARAIVDAWGEQNPYQAMRAGQFVDRAEYAASQQSETHPGFDRNELLQRLAEVVPDMPQYEAGMLQAMTNLGENHPLVLAAKNGNEQETASAVVSLYEIAKAANAGVSSTKKRVRQQSKDAAVAARRAAMVQSDSATPSGGQTPRRTMIAPGLSLEDLDAAFAADNQ